MPRVFAEVNFGSAWARIRQVTGWTKYPPLAELLNIQVGSIHGAQQKGLMPIEWPFKVALKYNVSMEWLLTGRGPMDAGAAVAERVHGYTARTSPAEAREFVAVPMMQGRISAGGGLVPDDRVEMAVAFRREWIERKGDVERMSVIHVQGDSMSPTLLPGDIVLVNHGVQAVGASGGIYAIAFKDQIMIKRVIVDFPSEKLSIISDNSDKREYRDFVADPDQVIINGKVIWYGRDLEK